MRSFPATAAIEWCSRREESVRAMSAAIERLLAIMARLRDPEGGCPWDLEQSFETIAPYTIEEAFEVADAIDRADYDGLKRELGDLLLQVVFHAQMASERDLFDFGAVCDAICEKMLRRHPHVFGEDRDADKAAVVRSWERIKAAERQAEGSAAAGLDAAAVPSALDDIALRLPTLMRAQKLQRRAAGLGFDWPEARAVLAKLAEEVAEIEAEMAAGGEHARLTDELGDLLFTCVNLGRKLGVDAETALRHANAKFERRFRALEAMLDDAARQHRRTAGLDELEALWQAVKAAETGDPA
ncbi:MAG: nucleoside triphosphate pyrophosphohydrolase [Defluviicoccus sp.]